MRLRARAAMALPVAWAFLAGGAEAAAAKRGAVSVAGAAFTDDLGSELCRVAKGPFASYRTDAAADDVDCDLVAGIQLPDGADLTSLSCSLYDGALDNAIEGYLVRVELASGDLQTVFVTPGTTDAGLQLLRDDVPEPGNERVANGKYAYYLAAAFAGTDFTASGSELRVYGCTVGYE